MRCDMMRCTNIWCARRSELGFFNFARSLGAPHSERKGQIGPHARGQNTHQEPSLVNFKRLLRRDKNHFDDQPYGRRGNDYLPPRPTEIPHDQGRHGSEWIKQLLDKDEERHA